MNEVEKLYENAGVKKINTCQSEINNGDTRFTGISHSDSYIKYPPFTAEKQIAIIKWLSDIANCIDICYDKYKGLFGMQIGLKYSGIGYNDDFAELLASRVNNIWDDLYPKNKEQIREILE